MISIDTDKLGNNKLPDVLSLLMVKSGYGECLDYPLKGLVKRTSKGLELTAKGEALLKKTVKTTNFDPIMERWMSLARKMQQEFPVGAMKYGNGNYKSWRGSTSVVAKKLMNFREKSNRDFTDEEVILAARKYVMTMGDRKRTLPFFISKVNQATGETEYLIEEWLDMIDVDIEGPKAGRQIVDDDFDDEDV